MSSSTATATPNISSNPEPPSDNASTLRKTKRKLDDAFQTLDNAVSPHETQRPSPPKRQNTLRSLYSTLAKYGVRTKEPRLASIAPAGGDNLVTSKTPHLTAILARAAARTRKALPFKFSAPSTQAPSLPPTADYRPSSLPAFLLRLSTFKLSTYANKPPTIDAVAASKCGWINDGKDRLVCGLCKSSWVVLGREGMSRDAANSLLEKQQASLVSMHKDGCPWKARQCDPNIYRIPLHSPANMVDEMKVNALKLEPLMQSVEIKHPLTSAQLSSLRSTLSSFESTSQAETNSDTSDQQAHDVFAPVSQPLSDTAILTSLFGWSLAPPPEPSRFGSLSRANSLAPSTPSLSRASSVRPTSPVPAPSTRPGTPTPARVPSSHFTFRMPSSVSFKRDTTTLLHCALCLRRVGLWAFAPQQTSISTRSSSPQRDPPTEGNATDHSEVPASPAVQAASSGKCPSPQKRQFDLLKEHRSYCPYVVRSTIVPTLPVPSPSVPNTPSHTRIRSLHVTSQQSKQNERGPAMEGWRAVLTVVLRYGVGQRQRLGLDFVERLRGNNPADPIDEPMEVDNIRAMVAGVKSRGGRDLLQYVKGLLG